jgi:ribosomal-protein-serine acetyltransferase
MTAAVRAYVDHAFQVWRLNRVSIEAAVDNARSRAVAERLGFRQEGVLREVERVGERAVDHVVYAVLAAEWAGGGASSASASGGARASSAPASGAARPEH